MNTITLIVGGALVLLLAIFLLHLAYSILNNLINGRKFHYALEQQFSRLRLSNMLNALGIDKTAYLYQNRVSDIQRHMSNCADCKKTDACDEKLSAENLDVSEIDFCNNESELKEIKQKIKQH